MTTSSQLFNKLYSFKSFYGVFPCDNLPSLDKLPASMIINTDPHDEPGQHWVALFINESSVGLYFDSYGFPPLNEEISNYMNYNCTCWLYNKFMIQGYNSVTCGEHCVLFVLLTTLGYGLWDIIDLFTTDFRTNDEIVRKLFDSL